MRTILYALMLFLPWYLFSRWFYCSQITKACSSKTTSSINAPTVPTDKIAATKTLILKDGTTTPLSDYEEFSFVRMKEMPTLNTNNNIFLDKITHFLKSSPDKGIKITGRYLKSESDRKPGMFENLGVARAASVRDLLVARGVSNARVALDYELADQISAPLAFETTRINDDVPVSHFSFEDMTFSDVNFEFNSSVFKPGPQFMLYMDSLKTFVLAHPKTELTIIGHTDNIGDDDKNERLGKQRSRAVKKFLLENAVPLKKITTETRGEREPVTSNETEEGRSKNRRVNCKLNY